MKNFENFFDLLTLTTLLVSCSISVFDGRFDVLSWQILATFWFSLAWFRKKMLEKWEKDN